MQSHIRTSHIKNIKKYSSLGKAINKSPTREFVNITIPVPWGQLSGKWYGPQHEQPILGLHGWQDNAGTYDLLAPLLPAQVPFLSLDLPGHGLSSHLPKGMLYTSFHNVYVIRLIMEYYKWEKLYLIGHSMSSIVGFMFAAIYPKRMAMFIGLDGIQPPLSNIDTIREHLDKTLLEDKRKLANAEPPFYTYDEIIERIFEGSVQSINKELCKYLALRHIEISQEFSNKYFFTRDRRIKHFDYGVFSQEFFIDMVQRITCPCLFIKALQSSIKTSNNFYNKVLTVLKKNDKFQLYECDGTHHVHLNNPERIIQPIMKYIEGYGPFSTKSIQMDDGIFNKSNSIITSKL